MMLSLTIQDWPDPWAHLDSFFPILSFLAFFFLLFSLFVSLPLRFVHLPPSYRIHANNINVPINSIPPQECLRNHHRYSIARLMVTTAGMYPART